MNFDAWTVVPMALSIVLFVLVVARIAIGVRARRRLLEERLDAAGRERTPLRERVRARTRSIAGGLDPRGRFTIERERVIECLRDLLTVGGIACIARGTYLIYPPAAWLVVGAIFVVLGVAGALGGRKKETE